MAITFPATSASPWTDPNGATWVWTGDAWRRTVSVGAAVVEATDAALATIVADDDSATRVAMDARYAKPARLHPMVRSRKIFDGEPFRVGLVGMSIASFTRSLPMLAERIRTTYGAGASRPQAAGVLGGSWTNAYLGWEKQPYGGPNFTRARGKAASSSDMRLAAYGDTISLWFSVESNSEACNIKIDGVVVGTTPAAGTQAYMQRQTFSVALGPHEVEIVKPAGAGYCYFERYEFYDSTNPGVIFHDMTLGGSSLTSMAVDRGAASGQVAGIAIGENVGIDGHFDNDDFDLWVVNHDVNDGGQGTTHVNDVFTPTLARIVQVTRDRVVPLVLVSSMLGHFTLESESADDYAACRIIRDLYQSTAATESHVTHIDWHSATALADIEKYAATYYPAVSALDVVAGTYTGDFIHPDTFAAYNALQSLCTSVMGLSPSFGRDITEEQQARNILPVVTPGAPVVRRAWESVSATCTLNGTTDTFTTPVAHGLAVGDKLIFKQISTSGGLTGFTGQPGWVHSTPSATTFTISYTDGGEQWVTASTGTYTGIGYVLRETSRDYTGTTEAGYLPKWCNGAASYRREGFDVVPVYFDRELTTPDEVGTFTWNGRSKITGAGTSDKWGDYFEPTIDQNLDVASGLHIWGQNAYILIRYSGHLAIRTGTTAIAAGMRFADEAGNALTEPFAGTWTTISYPDVAVGDQPQTAIVPVQGGASSVNYVVLDRVAEAVRVYDFAIMPSPVWPGRYA